MNLRYVGLVALVVPLLHGAPPLGAQEAGSCPADQTAEAICPCEVLLSKLPYLGKLFCKQSAEGCLACEGQSEAKSGRSPHVWRVAGRDGVERVGVNIDFSMAQPPVLAAGQVPANVCPVSAPLVKSCPAANQEERCPADSCPSLRSDDAGMRFECPSLAGLPQPSPMPGGMSGPLAGPMFLPAPFAMQPPPGDLVQVLESMRAEFAGRERELLLLLSEARVQAATAKAKAKSREEFAAKEAGLVEVLVASQLENAKLAAKLELAAEKEKLASELRQAQAELTVLKAQAEVAQLKLQLLERQQHEEATARKPSEPRR